MKKDATSNFRIQMRIRSNYNHNHSNKVKAPVGDIEEYKEKWKNES